MIVGTAGHVDHGKTSLVRALTGVDTDRLAEEKARGISIELGFAYTPLGDASLEPVGFVDVPGHRRFVQTMIAGATGIDLGLVVIAADDGPMPQTREHVRILSWLGVDELVVALTKVDAVDAARRVDAEREVRALLRDADRASTDVLPVSVVTGEGLDALRDALNRRRVAIGPGSDANDAKRRGARFRLAIDRSFVLQGIGLVVTGTASAGRVAVDDVLTLVPGGREARVRSIHAQDRPRRDAHAGQRVALNLVGRGIERSAVERGAWIVDPALAITADRIDVALFHESETSDLWSTSWRHVRFHAGTSSTNARIALLDDIQADASVSPAQLVFDEPMPVLAGDRFVLRDASLQDAGLRDAGVGTIAGGIVLDVDVPSRGRRSVERLAFLDVARREDAIRTLHAAIDASDRGIELARWNATHNSAIDALEVDARAAGDRTKPTLFSHRRWTALVDRVTSVLDAEHARAPDAVGPGRDRLRRMSAPSMPAAAFASLVDAMKADARIAQTGAWLHLPSHRVELSTDDRARFERLRAVVAASAERFNPPRVRDLAREVGEDEVDVRRLLVRLAARGEVYRVAHDHYFEPTAVRELAQVVASLQVDAGIARAAAFRDRIGIGRKVAIQILEFFDRIGYTRRVGDDHRVMQPDLFDA